MVDDNSDLLITLADELEELGSAVEKVTTDNRTQAEIWGNLFPALDRVELSDVPLSLAHRIRENVPPTIDGDYLAYLRDVITHVRQIRERIAPQLFSGNAAASHSYLSSLYTVDRILDRYLGWVGNPDITKLPPKLARRISAASARVSQIEEESGDIEEKVKAILAAHEAADQLPVEMESLRKASAHINSIEEEGIKSRERIRALEEDIQKARNQAAQDADEATRLVAQCDEAYRITTTTGLAAAFDQRAEKLRVSTNWWVAWLATALVAGCGLGAYRVAALSSVLSSETLNWGAIALHMVLSVVSVGAPLWFAWIATKQIQQRFKLAEDYAFKASVAKAYEGYRKEAARLDPDFASRLFASALTRLEEAPLRMIEGEPAHGGPWHELASSEGFKRALRQSTEFAERILDMAQTALTSTRSKKSASNEASAGNAKIEDIKQENAP